MLVEKKIVKNTVKILLVLSKQVKYLPSLVVKDC